ncbi:efflux RND transporter periplasmic adaptor subunit [Algiphilus sp.]|uniref:efflux RND transporter periplasmic adaptor subunit n=1 Tax=Algiphilus sp. TaxID=1872431 RepID=UPI003B5161FC
MAEQHQNTKLRRRVGIGIVVVLVGFFVFAFLPDPVPVDMATLERGPMTVHVRDEGRTRVRDIYIVSAPVSGHLLRLDGQVGDKVQAGETLIARFLPNDPAFLDARSRRQAEAAVRSARAALSLAEAEKRKAEAQLEFAKAEAARAQRLSERGSYSGADLERAELALKTAKAAFETARAAAQVRAAELENAQAVLTNPGEDNTAADDDGIVEVVAPTDGRILRVLQESETVVAAGTPLVELGDPQQMEIVVDVLSRDAVRIQEGAAVAITGWGGDHALAGTVRRIEPYGFTKVSALGIEEQRVNVIIDLDAPPAQWSSLGHGFRVDADITVWHADDVLRVPTSALFRHEGDWAAYLVNEGRAQRALLSIGKNNGELAEVLGGVDAGATVVLHPSERISDGVRLTSRSESP